MISCSTLPIREILVWSRGCSMNWLAVLIWILINGTSSSRYNTKNLDPGQRGVTVWLKYEPISSREPFWRCSFVCFITMIIFNSEFLPTAWIVRPELNPHRKYKTFCTNYYPLLTYPSVYCPSGKRNPWSLATWTRARRSEGTWCLSGWAW